MNILLRIKHYWLSLQSSATLIKKWYLHYYTWYNNEHLFVKKCVTYEEKLAHKALVLKVFKKEDHSFFKESLKGWLSSQRSICWEDYNKGIVKVPGKTIRKLSKGMSVNYKKLKAKDLPF